MPKTRSLIDKVTNGDTLKIDREINGCEMHSTECIKIYKRSDTLFASLTIHFNDGLIYPNLINSLSEKLIFAYAEFEKALKTYSPGAHGCTSTADYYVSLRSDSIKLRDGACGFQAHELLKEQLFGKAVIATYNSEIYRREDL